MHLKTLTLVLLGSMAAATHALAADGSSVGVGADYSSGKYGDTTSTDIFSLPLYYNYASGPWSFRLTVPYISISGPGGVIPGVGGTKGNNGNGNGNGGGTPPPPTPTTSSASGLGDVIAAGTYTLYGNASFGLDLTGKVKFGTADADQELGTGQNDYTAQLDAYGTSGAWTTFGGIAYSLLGDSDTLELNDVFGANLGASYRLNEHSSLGAMLDYRQKATDTSGARNEVTAFYNRHLNDTMRVQAYVLGGLSDGSPDWGAGVSFNTGF